jgi:hypothetical protein
MADVEPTNLCVTCKKQLDCNDKGIFQRETCDQYEARQLEDWLEYDKVVRELIVGACPICLGKNTYDCENNPLLQDISIGHCLDCETYWCLDCGYIFHVVEKGTSCPHWDICNQCPDQLGGMDSDTVIETECARCEFYDNGCQLENPRECEHSCPYAYSPDISGCPKIEEFLAGQT